MFTQGERGGGMGDNVTCSTWWQCHAPSITRGSFASSGNDDEVTRLRWRHYGCRRCWSKPDRSSTVDTKFKKKILTPEVYSNFCFFHFSSQSLSDCIFLLLFSIPRFDSHRPCHVTCMHRRFWGRRIEGGGGRRLKWSHYLFECQKSRQANSMFYAPVKIYECGDTTECRWLTLHCPESSYTSSCLRIRITVLRVVWGENNHK